MFRRDITICKGAWSTDPWDAAKRVDECKASAIEDLHACDFLTGVHELRTVIGAASSQGAGASEQEARMIGMIHT